MRRPQLQPITKTEAAIIALWLAIALVRQAAHDIRTIARWVRR